MSKQTKQSPSSNKSAHILGNGCVCVIILAFKHLICVHTVTWAHEQKGYNQDEPQNTNAKEQIDQASMLC